MYKHINLAYPEQVNPLRQKVNEGQLKGWRMGKDQKIENDQ